MRKGDEQDASNRVRHERKHILQSIEALKRLIEADSKNGHQDDALGGTEISAVNPRREDSDSQPRAAMLAPRTAGCKHAGYSRLNYYEYDRNQYKPWNDCDKCGWSVKQEYSTSQAPSGREGEQSPYAFSLTNQLASITVNTACIPPGYSDAVRDVGNKRRETQRYQSRKGD